MKIFWLLPTHLKSMTTTPRNRQGLGRPWSRRSKSLLRTRCGLKLGSQLPAAQYAHLAWVPKHGWNRSQQESANPNSLVGGFDLTELRGIARALPPGVLEAITAVVK
jgi:hypothetical protein